MMRQALAAPIGESASARMLEVGKDGFAPLDRPPRPCDRIVKSAPLVVVGGGPAALFELLKVAQRPGRERAFCFQPGLNVGELIAGRGA